MFGAARDEAEEGTQEELTDRVEESLQQENKADEGPQQKVTNLWMRAFKILLDVCVRAFKILLDLSVRAFKILLNYL